MDPLWGTLGNLWIIARNIKQETSSSGHELGTRENGGADLVVNSGIAGYRLQSFGRRFDSCRGRSTRVTLLTPTIATPAYPAQL